MSDGFRSLKILNTYICEFSFILIGLEFLGWILGICILISVLDEGLYLLRFEIFCEINNKIEKKIRKDY